jgi:acetyltransferase-like isoleucine patch superfamily enzyme
VSIAVKIRRGEGPFWGRVKWLVKKTFTLHVPVFWLTRPLFRVLYTLHVAGREGVARGLRFFWYEPLFRSQCEHVGENFEMEQLPFILGTGRIFIGNNVVFAGKPVFGFGNRLQALPEVHIGNDCFIGHACSLVASVSVRIGNHCLLAGGVQIYDYDGHPVDAERRRAKEPTPPEAIRPVVIGDDVWIGTNAFILKGVTVGPRSVIAAGSVVTRDVPPDVVVAGNPARVVKHLAEQPT